VLLSTVAPILCICEREQKQEEKVRGEKVRGERKQEEKGPTGIPWNGSCSLPNCYAKSA